MNVKAGEALNDVVALRTPSVDAKRKMGLGFHGQVPTRLARAPPYLKAAVSSSYLSKKLTRPLATKDGGTLRTILDARAYVLRLSKDQERSAQWQRAVQLLEHADVAAVSRQVELALFYDGKIDVTKA
jgi:hypothetical protein